MPKQAIKVEVNSFVKGLISEASPLNFPPNASFDEENFELNRDGTRNRRLGFDLEQGHSLISIPVGATGISTPTPATFTWQEAGGFAGFNLLVVQVDNFISLYNLDSEPLSGSHIWTSELDGFPLETRFSFASVDGKLVIVSGIVTIATITCKSRTEFELAYGLILTRDVWGVEGTDDEGKKYELDPTYRGNASPFHIYNLQNQSWGIPRKNVYGVLQDPSKIYYDALGRYPSSSEVVWTGLQYQPVPGGTPFERIYPDLYTDTFGLSFNSAKGHFIIDAINRGTSRDAAVVTNRLKYSSLFKTVVVEDVAEIAPTGTRDNGAFAKAQRQLALERVRLALLSADGTMNDYDVEFAPDYTDGGCTIVTEFAGRVFYGGFTGTTVGGDSRSPNLTNYIFFSQLVKSSPDIFKCHQEGDPTVKDESDIVDTDGGFIRVHGAERIVGMVNVVGALVVIASNGAWVITGGSEFGFSATNYKIEKVATFGGIAPLSLVEDGGNVFYWAAEGIYAIGKDQFGAFSAKSITDKTIQTFYENIPSISKTGCIGMYDPVGKKLRWLYQIETEVDGVFTPMELVLDLTLGAFYKNRIYLTEDNNVQVVGLFNTSPFNTSSGEDSVYVLSDLVLSSTDEVVVSEDVRSSSTQTIKYLCTINVSGVPYYTFGFYRNAGFKDWQRYDGVGVDAKAFMLTGAQIAGDSSVQKQIQYLTMHFNRTENGVDSNLEPLNQSSCFARMQWDWAGGAQSNKWSALRQMYRYSKPYTPTSILDTYDTGFDLITTKNLIRGRGRAFALYIETEAGKDCQLLGWSVAADGNQRV
mgnify:CR=1 FL=1